MKPDTADKQPVFRIDNLELLNLLGLSEKDKIIPTTTCSRTASTLTRRPSGLTRLTPPAGPFMSSS